MSYVIHMSKHVKSSFYAISDVRHLWLKAREKWRVTCDSNVKTCKITCLLRNFSRVPTKFFGQLTFFHLNSNNSSCVITFRKLRLIDQELHEQVCLSINIISYFLKIGTDIFGEALFSHLRQFLRLEFSCGSTMAFKIDALEITVFFLILGASNVWYKWLLIANLAHQKFVLTITQREWESRI